MRDNPAAAAQLDLLGGETPATVKLTPRQQIALDEIKRAGGLTDDELGALLHEHRRANGGRGHARDERCHWPRGSCADEGHQMGHTLRAKGLVTKRRASGLWQPAGAPTPANEPEPVDELPVPYNQLPPGF